MSASCPLNFEKVDANIARLSSLIVALSVVFYLYSDSVVILFFLAFDFVVRLFCNMALSPVNRIATFLKNIFGVKEKFTDGGAKRLAAYFGLLFVCLLIISHFYANYTVTLLVAGVFLSCSLLDVFFDFCIGCKIYYIIKKVYPNFMNTP